MSAASDFLEASLAEHFRGTQLPLPTNFYIALHTADPTDAGAANTEVTNGTGGAWPSYARQSVGTPLSSAWSAVADEPGTGGGKQITNANAINFPAHDGAADITITHFSVWDAATGGNMWISAPLDTPKTISPSDVFTALAGNLRLIFR